MIALNIKDNFVSELEHLVSILVLKRANIGNFLRETLCSERTTCHLRAWTEIKQVFYC